MNVFRIVAFQNLHCHRHYHYSFYSTILPKGNHRIFFLDCQIGGCTALIFQNSVVKALAYQFLAVPAKKKPSTPYWVQKSQTQPSRQCRVLFRVDNRLKNILDSLQRLILSLKALKNSAPVDAYTQLRPTLFVKTRWNGKYKFAKSS
jgi:hypothetical protein